MSFKIIQEFNKKNRAELTIIPAAFENNGVYWFPPSHWSTRKLNSVLRNPFAKPDICSWEARPCIVKKSNIPTFALAEEQEEELINKNVTEIDEEEDVESEASYPEDTKTKAKRTVKTTSSPQADFNSVLQDCLNSLSNNNYKESEAMIASDKNLHSESDIIVSLDPTEEQEGTIPEVIINENHPNYYNNNNNSDFVLLSGNENGTSLDYEGATSLILGNQQRIFQEISNLKEIVTSGIAKLLSQGECITNLKSIEINEDVKKSSIEAGDKFEKILLYEDAQDVEKQLTDVFFKGELIRKMAFCIGKNGKRIGEGWTCCYELVDIIFDRSFLKLCSWTGASTTKAEEGKIPFFKFKNILMLFASVVIDADPEFSIEKTKEFFKKLLRNATRFHSQQMLQPRKSTKRERATRKENNRPASRNNPSSGCSQSCSCVTDDKDLRPGSSIGKDN